MSNNNYGYDEIIKSVTNHFKYYKTFIIKDRLKKND